MANKRMFSMLIVDSDAFLSMPVSTQCLYFHLNMRADDDGFVGNPKKIIRSVGGSEDDLKILIMKRFILRFEDGVIVIKHWRMHNCISQNRYRETQYIDEKKMLKLKENKAYSLTSGEPLDDSKLVSSQSGIREIPELSNDQEVTEIENKGTAGQNKYPASFEDFWKEYPRKVDKGNAHKKYQERIKSGYSPEQLLQAAKNYRMECMKEHTPDKYIKYAKTFLGDATPFVDYIQKDETAAAASVAGNGEADFSRYL